MKPTPPPIDQQHEFLEAIDPARHFHELFEHLTEISFFVKNRRGQIMRANRSFLERFGFKEELEIIGKTDFELFSGGMAEHFRDDDQTVMRSGEPKINLVELFLNRMGIPDWFITNKLPLYGRSGKIIGVMGTVQNYNLRKRISRPYEDISKAVDFIRANLQESLLVTELAKMVGLSVRQFDRKFKDTFNITPKAFIIKSRVQAACETLREGHKNISEVACDLGFYDQSSFTLHFRTEMGITPLKYQKQFRLRGK